MANSSGQLPACDDPAIGAIVSDIEAEHRVWVDLIESLSPRQLAETRNGAWTALDTLAHITAWNENALRIARAQAEPDAPDPGPSRGPAGVLHINVDKFNQQVLDDHHAWSRDRVVKWSEQVHVSLLEALGALPTERVLNGRGRHGARQWFWMPAVQHSGGHRRQLERAIDPDGP